jgi:hypothetical protein
VVHRNSCIPRTIRGVVSVLVVLLSCSTAVASNEAAVSTAREIAKEGLNAYDAGHYVEANEKLSRALEVVGVPTLALYTARANVKLGKFVRASELYLLATRLDPKGPSETVQMQAQHDATKERAELLPRIPRLTVTLEGDDLGDVEVTVDGQVVPKALLGTSQLTDPGHPKVAAKRGDEQVSAEVELAEGEHKQTTMRFLPREKSIDQVGMPTVETKTQGPSKSESAGTAPMSSSGQTHQTQRVLGWVGIGLGGVGLAFGAATGGLALSKRSSLRDGGGCSGNSCFASQQQEVDSYNLMRTLSTVGFIAGGVFAATGATLLLTTPKAEHGAATALVLAPNSASLVGRF